MPLEEEIARTKKRLADLEKQKAMDKDDSDIEVIEAEQNYHGIKLSWRPLKKFLVKLMRSKHPHIKSQDAAYKQSAAYVNCWNIIGYTYQKLKEMTEDNDLKVQEKKIPTDYFSKYLWTKLNNNREALANNVSLSFLIDRSLDHFRHVIKLELKPTILSPTPPPPPNISIADSSLEDEEFILFLTRKLNEYKVTESLNYAMEIHKLILTTGLSMFDLLQFFAMDNLWYNGDTFQLRKVISYYLDKVDTNHLVIKINIKIKDLIDLCLHFCSGFFIKYPQKSSIIQKNPTCSGKYSDAIKLASCQKFFHQSGLLSQLLSFNEVKN